MPIAYAAHTESCTFLLDEEGICRQVIRRAAGMHRVPGEDSVGRCIGAQYVASIDAATTGGLVAMPKVGAPLLFAYVGADGRIALVRTRPLTRFETKHRLYTSPPPPPDESIEVEVDVDVALEQLEDPTHLFRRAPATAWSYDTSPPPPAPVYRSTLRPPPPLYGPPPPLPMHIQAVKVLDPLDSAPTIDRGHLAVAARAAGSGRDPNPHANRGVLPARRRGRAR
jgi:hypothetical protein